MIFLALVILGVVLRRTRFRPAALPSPMSQRWIAQFLYRDGKEH